MGYKRKAERSLYQDLSLNEKKTKQKPKCLLDLYIRGDIDGDGNCLFRAILFSLYRNDTDHYDLRQKICDYMQENQTTFHNLAEFDSEVGVTDFESYITYKRKNKTWGDFCELFAAAEMLKFNYILYKSESLEVIDHYFAHPTFPMIYLEFYNNNHYNSLIPREPKIKVDLSRSKDKKLISDKEKAKLNEEFSNQQKGFFNVQTYLEKKELLEAESEKEEVLEDKPEKKELLEAKSKKKVTKKDKFQKKETVEVKSEKIVERIIVENQTQEVCELYPKAKGKSDAYNEAYQYFKYGSRPKRIKDDKKFRNWKKDTAQRYELKNKASNKNSKSRLVMKTKKKNKRIENTIPLQSEIINIIEKAHNGFAHTKVKHNGISMTMRNISNMNLYWANMKNDITKYINNCVECVETQPIKQIKVSKVILAEGPLDRITADCWEIPKEMREASGNKFKHVLTCVDHFSKFKWTELLPNKLAKTMVSKFECIFNHFSNPKKFQTDNGSEFVNEEVKNLCKIRNIEFIHGRPYHPQSQGVVEKINDFLAKSLRASYSAFIKEKTKEVWDIETALRAFTTNANKNVHSVTLKVPNKLVLSDDPKEIQEVKQRIESYYNNKANKSIEKISLIIGTKVYIVKKMTKVKNKKRLVFRPQKIQSKSERNIKVRIPCTVEDISDLKNHVVKIKIRGRPTDDIALNETYSICVSNLEIAKSENSWLLLVNN